MKTDPHLIIEVRAAEGGDDAKSLVDVQVAIYQRVATRRSL
jgi:protein subunit release factor A